MAEKIMSKHNITPNSPPWPSLDHVAENTPHQTDIGKTVWLNVSGDNIPMYPRELSKNVRAGEVWIDYCDWPMWSRDGWITPRSLYRHGFKQFLQDAVLLFDHDFLSELDNFVYDRSLRTLEEPPGAFEFDYNAAYIQGEVYASFAIDMGRGYYFYANKGVPPAVYADFINSVMGTVPPDNDDEVPVKPDPVDSSPFGLILGGLALGAGVYYISQREEGE